MRYILSILLNDTDHAFDSFPESKKWMIAMTMSLFTLMSALASSMVAPAAFQIAADLNITATVEISMTLSIYVLDYGARFVFYAELIL